MKGVNYVYSEITLNYHEEKAKRDFLETKISRQDYQKIINQIQRERKLVHLSSEGKQAR